MAAGDLAHGLSFDGTNNAVYGKKSGGTILRHVGFSADLSSPTNWLIRSIETSQTRLVGTTFFETNEVKLLAGVMYGTGTGSTPPEHRTRVYDISNPAALSLVMDDLLPGPYAANGNGIGASDIVHDKVAFLEPNNGLSVYSLRFVSEIGPGITAQPVGNSNVLSGGYFTLDVSASGTAPLSYQWFLDGTPLPGATSKTLQLTGLELKNAGFYTVQVSNIVGRVTSSDAFVGVVPSGSSRAAQPLWANKPGDTFYLTADNTQRGLTYNRATGNLLLVSRAPTNGVHVLDAATGAYLRSLDLTGVGGVAGSTFDINMVAASDDGAVYVSGLTTTGSGYAIYRWENDSAGTLPAIVYQDNPGVARVGDTLAAYGSGASTVLFASGRNGNQVAIFTTGDGVFFTPNVVEVLDAPPGFAGLGLFAASSNVFWAKAYAEPLRQVTFDLTAQTNGVTRELDIGAGNINAIAIDAANDLAVGIGISQYPQNVALHDLRGANVATDTPVLLDQDFFLTSNPNLNGTGQIALDLAGGRIFALNSNNGLLALAYAPPLRHEMLGANLVLSWAGPAILTRSATANGPFTDVPGGSGVYTNTSTETVFYRLRR